MMSQRMVIGLVLLLRYCQGLKIEGEALVGKHKWLGGAMSKERHVYYGVPSHASSVLRIDPKREHVSLLDTPYKGKYQWLRAVYNEIDDTIWAMPCSRDHPLRIDERSHCIQQISNPIQNKNRKGWNWHGGQMGADGKIYAPPANANGILCIDPASQRVKEIPMSGINPKMQKNQFYGAISSEDQTTIYGVPFAADRVLKIECPSNAKEATCSTLPLPICGHRDFVGYQHNWHGGLLCQATGAIYCFPANSDTVLRIDPSTDNVQLLSVPGPRGKYQWAGGIQCPQSKIIYGVPSDANDILRIDPFTLSVSRFGSLYPDTTGKNTNINKKNLFQNALLGPDNNFYCIPCNADFILRINPLSDTIDQLAKGFLPAGKDKWQGGFFYDSILWAIPESADALLRFDISSLSLRFIGLSLH